MKITRSAVTKLTITDVPKLDPISVILEDIEPGRGKVVIECYGQAWSGYWGSMGEDTSVADFLRQCDTDYIANRIAGENLTHHEFDSDALRAQIRRDVLDQRHKNWLTAEEARRKFDLTDKIPVTAEALWAVESTMTELLGDDWPLQDLPTRINPLYAYLKRIVDAVKAALDVEHTQPQTQAQEAPAQTQQAAKADLELDLDHADMARLREAASQSNWIPQEHYTIGDWVSDCCAFLREGPRAFLDEGPARTPSTTPRPRG